MKTPILAALFLFLAVPALAAPTLEAQTSRPRTSTFPEGAKVEITFTAKDLSQSEETNLIISVKNELGNEIAPTQQVQLTPDSGGKATYVFSAPSTKLGYYEVKASLSDGTPLQAKGSRPEGFIPYIVVHDPHKRTDYGDTFSRFGIQGGYNTSALVIPYLGVRYMFAGNDWLRMEPERPGQFLQDRYKADKAGKSHPTKPPEYQNPIYDGAVWRTYHISLVSKASLPDWAVKPETTGTSCKFFGELNAKGEEALPPFALAQARAFAADYKYQKSRYYQVTWEPAYPWCYRGTPEGLVKIYKQVYDAIHQSDPAAIVVGPTLHNNPEEARQLQDLLNAGLGKYIDGLSFHPKPPAWPAEKNGMPQIIRDQVRAAEKAKGKRIPFIGTEQGLGSDKIGPLNKAMGDIRTSLMMLGEGASLDIGFYLIDFMESPTKNSGYGYYWNLTPKINSGPDTIAPKPGAAAYAAMTFLIDGTTSKGLLSNLKGTQLGYRFVRDKTLIDVAWDYDGTSVYPVPVGAEVCDWMGNCSKTDAITVILTGAPTYFVMKR